MKVLKVIVAIILSAALMASSALAMGSYAIDRAVSQEAIEKAIVETGAVEQLTDRILRDNTVNLGGGWGDTMKAILKSDAMTEFFSAYTATCLQSQIYGNEYEEIGSDELNDAFQKGIDECMAKGEINLGSFERKAFDVALNISMPALTKGINYVIKQMKLTEFLDDDSAEKLKTAQMITEPKVRYGSIGVAALMCLLLIMLFWGSKMGLLWCGTVILIVAAIFELFGIMVGQTAESSGQYMVLSQQMMYIMISYGLQKLAIVGGVAGIVAFPLCPILRKIFR